VWGIALWRFQTLNYKESNGEWNGYNNLLLLLLLNRLQGHRHANATEHHERAVTDTPPTTPHARTCAIRNADSHSHTCSL
jgi:hypothetical protein